MNKIKHKGKTVFCVVYVVITLGCVCFGILFSQYIALIFQIWYGLTIIVWLFLLIRAVILLKKRKKIKKSMTGRNKK